MSVMVKKHAEVPYTCEQMYTLVNQVEEYASFLPNCAESIVHYRDEDEVEATLVLAAAGLNKSFRTKNRLQPNKMIEIRLVNGPFSHLEGFWRFDSTETGGCQISFDLEFEFASKVVGMFLSPVFEEITKKVFDAFTERAKEVYGDKSFVTV